MFTFKSFVLPVSELYIVELYYMRPFLSCFFCLPQLVRFFCAVACSCTLCIFTAVGFHFMNSPQFVYPFRCHWAFRLFSVGTNADDTISSVQVSRSVMSDSSRPRGLQPTTLLHPWDFPGNSSGVGCHCLLQTTMEYYSAPKKDEMVPFAATWIDLEIIKVVKSDRERQT